MAEENNDSLVKVEQTRTVVFADDDFNANNDGVHSGDEKEKSSDGALDDPSGTDGHVGESGNPNNNDESFRQFLDYIHVDGKGAAASSQSDEVNNQYEGGQTHSQSAQMQQLIDRIEALEATHELDESWNDDGDNTTPCPQDSELGKFNDVKDERDRRLSRRSIIRRQETPWRYQRYPFPESTYTFMIIEGIFSLPFVVGLITTGTSLMCLGITLKNELDNSTDGNPYGMPAGVPRAVTMAQFLGIIIGVLMEEEVPQGLELIEKCVIQHMSGGHEFSSSKIVMSSIFRIAVGYMFLACLFLTVIQADQVLEIFFDVLALSFVENIDDVVFALCKRGFFGRRLRRASNKEHSFDPPARHSQVLKLYEKIHQGCLLHNGNYRCKSKTVAFGDEVWEKAWVRVGQCESDSDCGNRQLCRDSYCYEQRLLVYSHFNGIYEEIREQHHGRPRYVERNKEDGSEFQVTVPAEIIYCEDLEAWVFRHPNIRTSLDDREENECSWLLKSPQTESFDLVELGEDYWFVWLGQIEREYPIFVGCNDCYNDAGCNHHGKCNLEQQRCECYDTHFGIHCEFERPCEVIRSEKDSNTTMHLLHDNEDDWVHFVEVYGRPKYVSENMTGIPHGLMRLAEPDTDDKYFSVAYNDTALTNAEMLPPHRHYEDKFFLDDDFFDIHVEKPKFKELLKNYTFVLKYTGRRWYGQIKPPGVSAADFDEAEFHGFWSKTFSGIGVDDNSTVIISGPTAAGTPVGIDFYEMRRRNKVFEGDIYDYDYSPFGVLIPLTGYEGSGYFHCNKDDHYQSDLHQ